MSNATAPPPSLTCPGWCTDHRNPGHPEDQAHSAEFDGGVLTIRFDQYLLDDPGPGEVAFWVTHDTDLARLEDLRRLATAATAAADFLEKRQKEAAA